MSSTILVVDDSATIRRLADNTLSSAGYRVVLAPTAEDGMRLAAEEKPDLILLDHQLPGTTGVEVCGHLLADPKMAAIPIIASSTLRKQAYVEYANCSNVIDMLPKPYNEELLKSTVEHALATGGMVVDSQAHGTAVPEVINQVSGGELSGTIDQFSIREVIDFLNNGMKKGVLEVQSPSGRVWFFLDQGRIQAVTANGIDTSCILNTLPDSLQNLAPVLNLAVSGRSGSELDGLVQLLNNKVLDPRLLKKLLRHQASMLSVECFSMQATDFRFEFTNHAPPLFKDLPLETSLVALLVEGALRYSSNSEESEDSTFVRKTIRGQNLDRAGLSAKHQKIVGLLAQPHSVSQLTQKLHWEKSEVIGVLRGLQFADLIEEKASNSIPNVVVYEPDNEVASGLRQSLSEVDEFQIRVVRDHLSVKLILKREVPDLFVLPEPTSDEDMQFVQRIQETQEHPLKVVYASESPSNNEMLPRPFSPEQLLEFLRKCQTDEHSEQAVLAS